MDELLAILRKHWGYDSFRPLQAEAMASVVAGRDSVVVLPTGGGKSLCFQAPALQLPGLAVVVSPLISLMKDQVDALADNGVAAACVNSTLSVGEKRQVADDIRAGRLKLLYLSPERLMTDRTLEFLRGVPLSFFAIDEAHCISDWGHDFRPEYRMLSKLKEAFPGVAVHAYTATATARVRDDIARELGLKDPSILVGSFDRPNLVYRVQQRTDRLRQVQEVLARHPGEAGIIYCIRRADVDSLCAELGSVGVPALPYHAGLSDEMRKKHQDDFINDRVKLIVATVAFGMGIDKSDVRFVIHAAAPKSLEHYQQESGRAGRDGLEAECCLLTGAGDFALWRRIQSELPPEAYEIAMKALAGIEAFSAGLECRRKAILHHFGQEASADNCGACDVCLDGVELLDDALIVSQKILSCVARLKENFGGEYTTQVLSGSREQRIKDNQHDQLSTYGLLKEHDKRAIRAWIDQLVRQNYLRKEGEYQVLKLTPSGRLVLKGEESPKLLKAAQRPRREARVAVESWEGVDRGLFEALRGLRKDLAAARNIPPFIVFGDATLRELARFRPTTPERLRQIHGVGEKKLAEYGEALLDLIGAYCLEHGLEPDEAPLPPARRERPAPSGGGEVTAVKRQAFKLFADGRTVDEVAATMERAPSTVNGYLTEYLEHENISDPAPWLPAATFKRILAAASEHGLDRLKPLFEALGGEVGYDQLRIAVTCLRNAARAEE